MFAQWQEEGGTPKKQRWGTVLGTDFPTMLISDPVVAMVCSFERLCLYKWPTTKAVQCISCTSTSKREAPKDRWSQDSGSNCLHFQIVGAGGWEGHEAQVQASVPTVFSWWRCGFCQGHCSISWKIAWHAQSPGFNPQHHRNQACCQTIVSLALRRWRADVQGHRLGVWGQQGN